MKAKILVRDLETEKGIYVSGYDTDKAFVSESNRNGLHIVVVTPIENVIEYCENPFDDEGYFVKGEGYIITGTMYEIEKQFLKMFGDEDYSGYKLEKSQDMEDYFRLEAKKEREVTAFKALIQKYGFTLLESCGGAIISLCAKDTDGKERQWIIYTNHANRESEISIAGNTDNLNLWFCETRPDMAPEKILEFVEDFNACFEWDSDSKPFKVSDFIDAEDWQEIAGVSAARKDTRYQ